MKIAIDAGHGLYTAGKRCSKQFDENETREWTLNSRVATKVCQILNNIGVETIRLDDTTGETDIPLNTRTKNANNSNADLVVSIHHNAGGGTGIETYVYNNACLNGETGKIAKAINDKVVEKTDMKNRGIKIGDFAIIRDTKMKACLIECGFMDNEKDTPLILTEEYANKVAEGIAEAICNYYSINKPIEPIPTPIEPTKVDVIYQTYTNGRWQPNVKNTEDYAGVFGLPVTGVYANLSNGNITYKVHTKGGRWLPEVTDRKDFAGILGKHIDGLMMKSNNGTVRYRVHILGKNWLPWVTGYNEKDYNNGYAGIIGQVIDAIQIEIV